MILRCLVRLCLISCLLFFLAPLSFAAAPDADEQAIVDTLTDYMEGTARGQPERLRKAFHPDFKLYTVKESGELLIRSGEQYIAAIKPGESIDRIGRILAIDRENDSATAKVEIVMPGFRVYTDYFLLLKYAGSWKIVQKSYTWRAAAQKNRKILIVTSNQHTYGDTKINTANHFQEIVIAYDVFRQQGYEVDFVSPQGGAIPLGYIETSDPVQKAHLYDAGFMQRLKTTRHPGQVRAEDYRAVYYSGGGAAMFGVAQDRAIQAIAEGIHARGGVIAAVCHGSAGIVNLKDGKGKSLLANRRITGFPDLFEDRDAAYYKTFPYSIDQEIARKGGHFTYSRTFGDGFHIADQNLITGQDPSSTRIVAQLVVQRLAQAL